MLLGYAVASFVYRWVVTFSVFWLLHRFLKSYHLEILGTLLAAVSGLAWSVGRWDERSETWLATGGGLK